MRFSVTLDRDEDGIWVVECHSIPGCVSQDQTKQDVRKTRELRLNDIPRHRTNRP
jgi:predicted RNase H-like HicB family nuclease